MAEEVTPWISLSIVNIITWVVTIADIVFVVVRGFYALGFSFDGLTPTNTQFWNNIIILGGPLFSEGTTLFLLLISTILPWLELAPGNSYQINVWLASLFFPVQLVGGFVSGGGTALEIAMIFPVYYLTKVDSLNYFLWGFVVVGFGILISTIVGLSLITFWENAIEIVRAWNMWSWLPSAVAWAIETIEEFLQIIEGKPVLLLTTMLLFLLGVLIEGLNVWWWISNIAQYFLDGGDFGRATTALEFELSTLVSNTFTGDLLTFMQILVAALFVGRQLLLLSVVGVTLACSAFVYMLGVVAFDKLPPEDNWDTRIGRWMSEQFWMQDQWWMNRPPEAQASLVGFFDSVELYQKISALIDLLKDWYSAKDLLTLGITVYLFNFIQLLVWGEQAFYFYRVLTD